MAELTTFAKQARTWHPNWEHQTFEYYAFHWIIGSGLGLSGDALDARIRSLADALKRQYDVGVEHGRKAVDVQLMPTNRS